MPTYVPYCSVGMGNKRSSTKLSTTAGYGSPRIYFDKGGLESCFKSTSTVTLALVGPKLRASSDNERDAQPDAAAAVGEVGAGEAALAMIAASASLTPQPRTGSAEIAISSAVCVAGSGMGKGLVGKSLCAECLSLIIEAQLLVRL